MLATTQFATNFVILYLFLGIAGAYPTTFTVVNKCNHTVWPAISPRPITPMLSTTGFALAPGELSTISIAIPPSWSGHLWARTLCANDINGKFACVTGDCSSSTVECDDGSATPPATLAEFILNASSGQDFFKVSFLEGYNIPIIIEPKSGNGIGECTMVGCDVDLNSLCPSEAKLMRGSDCVACKNACSLSGDHKFCKLFSGACPLANIDASKMFQGICASTNYLITFCPKTTSKSSSMEKWAWLTSNIKSIVIVILSFLTFVVIAVVITLTVSCSSEGCRFHFGFFARTIFSTNT